VTGRTVSALETPSHTTEVTNIDNRHRLAKRTTPGAGRQTQSPSVEDRHAGNL